MKDYSEIARGLSRPHKSWVKKGNFEASKEEGEDFNPLDPNSIPQAQNANSTILQGAINEKAPTLVQDPIHTLGRVYSRYVYFKDISMSTKLLLRCSF